MWECKNLHGQLLNLTDSAPRVDGADVPDAKGSVERGSCDEVFGRVPPCAHDDISMADEVSNPLATLPVPDSCGTIIGGGDEVRVMSGVKEDRPNIVCMASKCVDERSIQGPKLYDSVIAACREEGLSGVDVNGTDWGAMSLESINKSADDIVPDRDGTVVAREEDPGLLGVEGRALHASCWDVRHAEKHF